MKRIRYRLLSLLIAAVVAVPLIACGHSGANSHARMGFGGGSVSLKNGTVVIKLKGHDTARVGGDGGLSIGGQDVAVSPQARAALVRYNASAQGFTSQAMDLGVDSADFAMHTIGQVFKGMLHGNVDQAGKEAEQGGHVIEARAKALCQRLQDWRQAQDAAAAAAPEFQPYALISAHDTDDCYVEDGKPAPKTDPGPQISS